MRASLFIILIFTLSDICVADDKADIRPSEAKSQWSANRFEHRDQDAKRVKEFVSALLDENRTPPIEPLTTNFSTGVK